MCIDIYFGDRVFANRPYPPAPFPHCMEKGENALAPSATPWGGGWGWG